MSTYSTIQSRKIVLTKEESDYFESITDEDFKQYVDWIARKRIEVASKTVSERDTYFEEGFKDPFRSVGCRAFAIILSGYVVDKKDKIIDIGAGTGFLGKAVKKLGYENIDGLEPVEDMHKMQPEGVYDKMYNEFLSKEKPTSIPNESYDCVMIAASVLPAHIGVDEFPDIIRIVKPGGYIMFNICDYWYNYENFGQGIDTMLQRSLADGTIDTVTKQRIVYMYRYDDATLFILKKV